jgi:ketosteroid isomerase-like protein
LKRHAAHSNPVANPVASTRPPDERTGQAVLGWFGGVASTLDYTTFEPREFIAQNDKVVSPVYSEATVRDTGRAFVNPEAHVWTLRDGKLARFQSYHDTAAAAAAHRVE